MAKKSSRRLVALSLSAIAAVYLAGYQETQGADASMELPTAAAVTAPSSPAVGPSAGVLTPTPASVGYRDGTYAGLGRSRRGDIGVSVTIQGGRIDSVTITHSTTEYPVSWIGQLPGQVVARQRAQVDLISGATYSAVAFRAAVQQALAQAQSSGAQAATPPQGAAAPPTPAAPPASRNEPASPSRVPPGRAAPQQLAVTVTDTGVQPPLLQAQAGLIEIVVTNQGQHTRHVTISGEETEGGSADITPGRTIRLQGIAPPGDYTITIDSDAGVAQSNVHLSVQ